MEKIGISVKHYSNSFSGEKPPICRDYGESNTDKSTYRPDLSLARAYQGAQNKRLIYDFNDGKDTGNVVQTFIRSKGLDITEIDTAQQRITKIIEDKKKTGLEKFKSEKEKKDYLDNIKKMANSVDSQDSIDSNNPTLSSK